MPVYTGAESTYTGTTVPVRQLSDHIYSTDKDEYPLLKAIGLDSFDEEIFATKVEWLKFSGIPTKDTLAAAYTAGGTTLTVSNSEYFKVGDILLIDNELFWITSINYGADQLTVTYAFAGTTNANHANGSTVYKIGNAQLEGSSPGTHRAASFDTEYNYTQIFDLGTAEVTGTEEAVKSYGVDSLMQFRIDQNLRKGYMEMERAILYGRRAVGSANSARAMGGLTQYVTDVVDKGGAALAEADIINRMEAIWGRCGAEFRPNVMVGNSWAKRKVTSFYAGSSGAPRFYERQERVGGYYVTTIETDFGTLDFILNHLVKPDELWLLNLDYVMMGPLRGRSLRDVEASTPGADHFKRRIFGEYTLKVVNPDALALIKNFSTSS